MPIDITSDASKRAQEELNNFFNSNPDLARAVLPRNARWRYFRIKKDTYAYSWTTEKVQGLYWYRKWRIYKNGTWRVVEKRGYPTATSAKRDAHQQYLIREEKKNAKKEN